MLNLEICFYERNLTTHSTGAELARMSSARLDAARQFFQPG